MNIVCRLVERSVAASVARGDETLAAWVRIHLDRCSACRQVRADMDAIHNRLSEALDAPEPSDAFVERVWAGIDAAATAPNPHRHAHLAVWAGVGACALAFVLAVPRVLPDGTPGTNRAFGTDGSGRGRRTAMAAPDVGPGAQARTRRTNAEQRIAKAKPGTDRRASDRASAAQDAAIRRLILQRRRLAKTPAAMEAQGAMEGTASNRGRTLRTALRGSAGASPSHGVSRSHGATPSQANSNAQRTGSTNTGTTQPSLGWVDIAQFYEYQHDASSAAYAYRQALREKTDAGTAYAAGRTSEAAGDILTAVECLAEMLDTPPTASSTGDGVSHRPGERGGWALVSDRRWDRSDGWDGWDA